MALDRRLTGIYLNDHLAGATVGCNLAGRSLGANRGNDFGRFLEPLKAQIEEDRATLRAVMRTLGVKEDPVKRAGALIGERLGRLKLNGSLREYSPLSRLVELEGLALGVEGKLGLWLALAEIDAPELAQFDFAALAERARAQRIGIEAQRLEAARLALSAS
jgi:hypothetical protein